MISDWSSLFNLLLLIWMWVAAQYSYNMIGFQLKYIPGDIYINTMAACVSEGLAIVLSAFFMAKLNYKISLVVFLLLGGMSCLYLVE